MNCNILSHGAAYETGSNDGFASPTASLADLPCWNSTLTGWACDNWRACDLVLAVQLARTQADLAAETERLAVEGMVIASAKAGRNPITIPPQGTSGNANGVYIA